METELARIRKVKLADQISLCERITSDSATPDLLSSVSCLLPGALLSLTFANVR